MKTAKLVLAVMVGVVLLGSVALAEEGAPGDRKQRRMRVREEARKGRLERMVKDLDLTAEQQKQVKQILDTHQQAIENWMKENGEDLKALREQMRKARKDKDHEALKGLRKKMADGTKGRRELHAALRKQIDAVLTDKQKAQAKKMRYQRYRAVIGARMVHRALGQVNLSNEQKEKVKKIVADTKTAADKAKTPKEKGELWQKAVKTIKSDVLTKEQAKKFEQALLRMRRRQRQMSLFGALNLTEDQKAKSKKIRETYREKIKDAKPEERRELIKKMREELESILTDEQKAKAKKHRERGRKMFRNRAANALGLTDKQKEQMEKIEAGYRDKIKKAGPEERRELIKKMREEMSGVLTDEQKAKAKERREEQRKRWQNRRGRNEGRRGRGRRGGGGPAEDNDE